MSLLSDTIGWDRNRLIELVRTQQEGLTEILERIHDAGVGWREPMSRRTAEDLLNDVRALGEGALRQPDVDTSRLVEVANVQYDAILAGIDLLKSHSDVPKVPRPAP